MAVVCGQELQATYYVCLGCGVLVDQTIKARLYLHARVDSQILHGIALCVNRKSLHTVFAT